MIILNNTIFLKSVIRNLDSFILHVPPLHTLSFVFVSFYPSSVCLSLSPQYPPNSRFSVLPVCSQQNLVCGPVATSGSFLEMQGFPASPSSVSVLHLNYKIRIWGVGLRNLCFNQLPKTESYTHSSVKTILDLVAA